MMNLKKWHLEKYQELRYLSQQIARNEAEASGQQSRDQQCINWTTSIQGELNFYWPFKWPKKNMHNSKRTE